MKTYVGTKIINAKPMTRGDYHAFRGWTVPYEENPTDEGYLVEDPDVSKGNTALYAGYVSWIQKEQFEKVYRATDGLTFGLALDALKKGHRVARAGWNGKGMWLSLSGVANITRDVPAEAFWSEHNARYAAEQPDRVAKVLPCITMKTATGEILMGWLASQSDMLSEDWFILK